MSELHKRRPRLHTTVDCLTFGTQAGSHRHVLLELAVEAGDLTPAQATAMGGLVARLLDLAKFALEAQQTAEIEERLRQLEATSGGGYPGSR